MPGRSCSPRSVGTSAVFDAVRVLVVERDAHKSTGHFPNLFARLAEGFAELGFEVHAMTQDGWLAAGSSDAAHFHVHRYPWWAMRVDRLAMEARREPDRMRWLVAYSVSTILGALSVRRFARRTGPPALVVVVTWDTEPALFSLVAGARDVLVYAFYGPPKRTDGITRWARSMAQRLRTGPLTVVTPAEDTRAAWEARLPEVVVRSAPIAGVPPVLSHPRDTAREALGIEPGSRVALLFGSGHDDVDVDVVRRAFDLGADRDGTRLVVAGKLTARLDDWDRDDVTRYPGFVSTTVRDQLYSAADVVILSFVDGYHRDSGTLMDALAHGRPVVVSRGSSAAAIVERYGLGVQFDAGDEASLVAALGRVPVELGPEVLAVARAELSVAAVAARLFEIAGFAPVPTRR